MGVMPKIAKGFLTSGGFLWRVVSYKWGGLQEETRRTEALLVDFGPDRADANRTRALRFQEAVELLLKNKMRSRPNGEKCKLNKCAHENIVTKA